MSDLIMEKLGSQSLSPAMQTVMLRAKSAGLHKIAANMRGVDNFTFRDAVLELSTKLAYDHLKRQKIASGMRALRALEASGDIKLAALKRAAFFPAAGAAATAGYKGLKGTLGKKPMPMAASKPMGSTTQSKLIRDTSDIMNVHSANKQLGGAQSVLQAHPR